MKKVFMLFLLIAGIFTFFYLYQTKTTPVTQAEQQTAGVNEEKQEDQAMDEKVGF